MTPEESEAALRARIVIETLSWIGTPYRHQASVKGQGADCLGLIRGVFRAVNGTEPGEIPAYPRRLYGPAETLLDGAAAYLTRRATPQLGDVLIFRLRRRQPASHCGILVAPDRFVHAFEGRAVLSTAFEGLWRAKLAASFSFPEI